MSVEKETDLLQSLRDFFQIHISIDSIKAKKVTVIINIFNPRKARGHKFVPAVIPEQVPPETMKRFTYLYNA